MSATETLPLRLHKLEIENFLRIEALQVDADGQHVIITGGNGVGKTSSVNAIWIALGGKAPKEPVHNGAERASVKLDLGEYTVERVWTEKTTRLVVTAADGSKVARPQQLLDGLLGRYALDPVAFLERRPQDQVDDVLQLAGVGPPVDEVRVITGESHYSKPNESASAYLERLSADDVGLYYVRRRDAHRTWEQKRAALAEQRQALDALGGPIRPDEPEASASALLRQIEQLQQKADQRRAVQADLDKAKAEQQDVVRRLQSVEAERQRECSACEELTAQIKELHRQLSQRRENVAHLDQRIANGRLFAHEAEQEVQAISAAVEQLPDATPQLIQLRQQVAAVERTTETQAKRRFLWEETGRIAQDVERAVGEHRTLDNVLGALRGLRAHLLDGVDLGVPGLQVGLGELRLNDVPLRQASQAEQIRVACAVAMRQQPKLRLLRVDEGERLDRNSRELLFKLADQNQWQVIFTAVADTDALRVEIIDREVSGQKLYSLTREGRIAAGQLAGPPEKTPVANGKPAELSPAQQTLLASLLTSVAVVKYEQGLKLEVRFPDACAFWGIHEPMRGMAVDAQLALVLTVLADIAGVVGQHDATLPDGRCVTAGDLSMLSRVNAYLHDRFSRHMSLLRNRRVS